MREEHIIVLNNVGNSNEEHVTDPVSTASDSVKAFREYKDIYEGTEGRRIAP